MVSFSLNTRLKPIEVIMFMENIVKETLLFFEGLICVIDHYQEVYCRALTVRRNVPVGPLDESYVKKRDTKFS